MTDTDQTNDTVTADSSETVVKKKTSKKTRKKTAVKSTTAASEASTASETIAASEAVSESVDANKSAQTDKTASTAENDKRAQLINKLKDMGVMQSTAVASAAAATAASSKKILANNIPAWMTPQIMAVAAGAAVFSVLIWSLENEKQDSQPQTANVTPVYAPYGAPPVMMHPVQQAAPMYEQAQQVTPFQPPVMEQPAYQVQQPNLPSATQSQAQNEQAHRVYPAPNMYNNQYGYGYGFHPSMQFGFNSRMHGYGQGQGQGAGAPQYYGYHPAYGPYPAPAYGYPPVGNQGNQNR